MKAFLKFVALVVVVTIAFLIVSALIPYSDMLGEVHQDVDESAFLYLLLSHTWLCFAIWYVVTKSPWGKSGLGIWLTASLFFVTSFMTQIETFFFRSAFPILTNADIFWITIANGVPVFVGVPLALYLFTPNESAVHSGLKLTLPPIRELAPQFTLIGMVYLCIYFLFGHFVAWQVEELRVFYSGRTENLGFFPQLMHNLEENPVIFPFQFFRGIMFGVFLLPLVLMFQTKHKTMLISLILVLVYTGFPLVIPNPLFPDSVRLAHLREMISSMFVFSIIVWYVFTKFPTTNPGSS